MKKLFLTLLCCFIGTSYAKSTIGIIIPLKEESGYLQSQLTHKKSITINGIRYQTGQINHKPVVFVNSGLGVVNAAIVATRLIQDFNPDIIILSGSSGNLNPALKKGDVVIGNQVIDVDLGNLTANGTRFDFPNYLFNPNNHKQLPLVFTLDETSKQQFKKNQPSVFLGTIASSDQLPNPANQVKLMQQAKMDVIEMEGAPTMQACWLFHKRCLIIRGVSNNMNEPFTNDDIILAGDDAAKVLINFISDYKIKK